MHIPILAQPNDETCGPTSLHAVYQYYQHAITLEELIATTEFLPEGGTLAVFLGLHALGLGFQVRLYTYNLTLFDPTWAGLSSDCLQKKLLAQLRYKTSEKIRQATAAYRQFLAKGGEIRFEELTLELLTRYLQRRIPILTGLSATYLYQSQREYSLADHQSIYDDLQGEPMGHFVVLNGLNEQGYMRISDPYLANPLAQQHFYTVRPQRLINAILLGVLTYDANLLIIAPRRIELP